MSQLSLLEQARLEAPQLSDEERVAVLAAELIEQLEARPPINLEMIASWQGVEKIEVDDIPWAGCLINDGGHVLMKLRRGDSRRRRRFTGFHEIGHTFCPGFRLEPQYRCNPVISQKKATIEGLCDVAASEMLFPKDLIAEDLKQASFGLDAVEAISDRYDGSIEAAAHRFVNLWPEDVVLLVLEPGLRKEELSDPAAEEKLRVRSVHANGRWPFIPRNKSAPSEGPLERAFNGELIDERSTLEGICAGTTSVDVSARLFPYWRDGDRIDRVFGLYRRGARA
jgi:hypothetical protein